MYFCQISVKVCRLFFFIIYRIQGLFSPPHLRVSEAFCRMRHNTMDTIVIQLPYFLKYRQVPECLLKISAEREGAYWKEGAYSRGALVVFLEVTGPRRLGNGLVVPGKFTASTVQVRTKRTTQTQAQLTFYAYIFFSDTSTESTRRVFSCASCFCYASL